MIVLTAQELSALMDDYNMIAWSVTRRFVGTKTSSLFDIEDLHQECMLVLVKHMQSCETKAQLRQIQTMELVNAMTRYVLKTQTVRLDHNRTDQAKRILDSAPRRTSYENLEELTMIGRNPVDDLIDVLCFESFVQAECTPTEQQIVSMRRDGASYTEISRRRNVSPQSIHKSVHRVADRYRKYVSDAQ